MQRERNGLISPTHKEKLSELLCTTSKKKKERENGSSTLKPNTKSLLPDRFGKRIISAARVIFAAYIREACRGIEQEMELGQKPIYGFGGKTFYKKYKSG